MKKGKQEQKVDEWRLYKLHCECVRRNGRYAKDYQEWLSNHKKDPAYTFYITGRWKLIRSEEPPNPIERPSLDEIKMLVPPQKIRTPKEDEVDRFVEKGLHEIAMGPYLEPSNVPASAGGLVIVTYFHENNPKKWERSAINMRLSKASIMSSFEALVDLWIKERKEAGLKQQPAAGRIHLDSCIEYLKVCDLRKEGKSFRKIGELLWPGGYGDREEKAKEYYKNAQKLVMNPPLLGKAS